MRCDFDSNGVSAGKEKQCDNKSPSFRLTPEREREIGGAKQRDDQKMGSESRKQEI